MMTVVVKTTAMMQIKKKKRRKTNVHCNFGSMRTPGPWDLGLPSGPVHGPQNYEHGVCTMVSPSLLKDPIEPGEEGVRGWGAHVDFAHS